MKKQVSKEEMDKLKEADKRIKKAKKEENEKKDKE
tara:strand:- start:1349 stop:1453 length:105 start_codon:yes stop_codon:yes gene_type:complete